jgi:predicted nucleic acid-binding protein
MRRSGRRIQRFFPDTNLFISAIKAPGKPGRSLELFVELMDKRYELVGNTYLVDEYSRYSEAIESDLSRFLLMELCSRLRVVEVAERFVRICRPYFPESEAADVLFAATCLQEGAVMITNDRDFDKISEAGIIEVWSISEAIGALLD